MRGGVEWERHRAHGDVVVVVVAGPLLGVEMPWWSAASLARARLPQGGLGWWRLSRAEERLYSEYWTIDRAVEGGRRRGSQKNRNKKPKQKKKKTRERETRRVVMGQRAVRSGQVRRDLQSDPYPTTARRVTSTRPVCGTARGWNGTGTGRGRRDAGGRRKLFGADEVGAMVRVEVCVVDVSPVERTGGRASERAGGTSAWGGFWGRLATISQAGLPV